MAVHLWQAAQEKAEQLQRDGGTKRGDLGLNIHDWVDVLRVANNGRRWILALVIVTGTGWLVAAAEWLTR